MGLEIVSSVCPSGSRAKSILTHLLRQHTPGLLKSQWLAGAKGNARATDVHAHVWIRSLHDCRYPPSTSGSAGRDGDEELHQALVDVAGGGRLDNEDIFVADRLADGEGGFLVRVVEGDGPCDLDSESMTKQSLGIVVELDDGAKPQCDARYRIFSREQNDRGRVHVSRYAYRFATFSLSSGWLLPLMSLISFAISPDMLSRSRRTRQVDDRPAMG